MIFANDYGALVISGANFEGSAFLWLLQVVEQAQAASAFCDSGSGSQHFFLRGGRIGA
jgi:hypothetical protein